MKPNQLKRLEIADYDEAPEWFKEKFLPTLSQFINETNTLLTRNIQFSDNFNSETRELELNNDERTNIKHKLPSPPNFVFFAQAGEATFLGNAWGVVDGETIWVKVKIDTNKAKVKLLLLV